MLKKIEVYLVLSVGAVLLGMFLVGMIDDAMLDMAASLSETIGSN